MLILLRRPEGATVAQVAGSTAWAMHTVRGFFAGLKIIGHRGHRAGAGTAGRARQAGRQGQLQLLSRGGGRLMRVRPTPASYAVGLYRVSRAEQGQSGLALEATQASMRAFVAAQGWTLVAELSDVASGKDDRRPGFQAALLRCRQLGAVLVGAVLVGARLDRITRRAHTLSQLLEDGYSVRAADMPGADDLMMRVYAATAQKVRELISERTRAALAAAKARGACWAGIAVTGRQRRPVRLRRPSSVRRWPTRRRTGSGWRSSGSRARGLRRWSA